MNRPSTIFIGSNRPGPRRPARTRRRVYADFRELLELEPEAKRLGVASGHAHPLPAEPAAPELQENALAFPKPHRDSSWTDDQNAVPFPTAPVETLDPHFKVSVEPPSVIVVDQRMTMFYGSRRNTKSVVAAKAAAFIAWRMLAEKRPVGALVFNDRKIVQLRPHCSRLRVILILHALLNQNHALLPNTGIRSNLTMLNEALRRTEPLARNSLVFLITDASGHDEETSRLASAVSRDKRLLVVLVYDPRQTEFRGAGSFITGPCGQPPGSETGDRHSRETLHGTFGRQPSIGRRFFPDEVSIIPLNTRDDVADQLRRSLKRLCLSPGISLSELNPLKFEPKERATPTADEAGSPANWNITTGIQTDPPAGARQP
jgi:hypothetical protein